MILLPLFINQLKATPPTPQEQHEKIATIKYSLRWWHSQLENCSLQKIAVYLELAVRKKLVEKESSGYGSYRIYIPCRHLGKNKREREEKIFDFLLQMLDK